MTAPDPARLHQSIRQLEGDGGRVDVEQLKWQLAAANEITPGPWTWKQNWIDFGVPDNSRALQDAGGNYLGDIVIRHNENNADLVVTAVNALPALLDLIRRQDAALTAVRELADGLDGDARAYRDVGPAGELDAETAALIAEDAADRVRRALASPDTTKDGAA